ncbi:MAG TPA: hypothetical protein VJ487_10565, partial [Alphaproteobacteria bacterium]|nr:hypothetical protein [Alphaproteobacteria bacterium]
SLAHGIWIAQFDHPYDGAYYQALSELSQDDRKSFLVMAAQGADQYSTLLLSVLIVELAAWNDRALGAIIARWTKLPSVNSAFPQDAYKIFASAHIAMGRLGNALPSASNGGDSEAAKALMALGRVLYWLNRCDVPMEERRAACAGAIATLSRHDAGVSAGILWELQHSYLGEGLNRLPGSDPVQISLHEPFRSEVAAICRQALIRPQNQKGFFIYTSRDEILEFAVRSLGLCGDQADIAILRDLSSDHRLGHAAIESIRKLEQVEASA